MKKATCLTDDQCWQSVLARDPNADGEFVFAVRTTGIFCRPSCRARHALRENVSFYANASEALAAGFRPCKRCQPEKANAQCIDSLEVRKKPGGHWIIRDLAGLDLVGLASQ